MPSVLVAPDSFKGTLTAAQVAEAVSAGLVRARPDLDVLALPVADGGEGTLAAAVAAGFEPRGGHRQRTDRRAGAGGVRPAG